MPTMNLNMADRMYDFLTLTAIYYQKQPDELIFELLTAFFDQDGNDIEGLAYIIAGRGYKAWKNECKAVRKQQDAAFDEEIKKYGPKNPQKQSEYKKDRFRKYWEENKATMKEDFYRNFTGFLRDQGLRIEVIENVVDKTKNMILWEGRESL